jgi:hypothetical protein
MFFCNLYFVSHLCIWDSLVRSQERSIWSLIHQASNWSCTHFVGVRCLFLGEKSSMIWFHILINLLGEYQATNACGCCFPPKIVCVHLWFNTLSSGDFTYVQITLKNLVWSLKKSNLHEVRMKGCYWWMGDRMYRE